MTVGIGLHFHSRISKGAVTTTDNNVAPSASPMTATERHLNNLCEVTYEFAVQKAIHALACRCLSLRRTRVIYGAGAISNHDFVNTLNDAEDDGVISSEELAELLSLDLVFTARRPSDNANVHVAAEISITADHEDIERAANRAGMLARAVNQPVIPLVVSANVGDAETRLANDNGVVVVVQPEAGEG